jgi:hypothetical protein
VVEVDKDAEAEFTPSRSTSVGGSVSAPKSWPFPLTSLRIWPTELDCISAAQGFSLCRMRRKSRPAREHCRPGRRDPFLSRHAGYGFVCCAFLRAGLLTVCGQYCARNDAGAPFEHRDGVSLRAVVVCASPPPCAQTLCGPLRSARCGEFGPVGSNRSRSHRCHNTRRPS